MSTPHPSRAPSARPVSVGHLVTGLVFVGIAAVWALRASGLVGADQLGWLFPGVLVAAGAAGLAAFVARARSREHDPRTDDPRTDEEMLSYDETLLYPPDPGDRETGAETDPTTETHPTARLEGDDPR